MHQHEKYVEAIKKPFQMVPWVAAQFNRRRDLKLAYGAQKRCCTPYSFIIQLVTTDVDVRHLFGANKRTIENTLLGD